MARVRLAFDQRKAAHAATHAAQGTVADARACFVCATFAAKAAPARRVAWPGARSQRATQTFPTREAGTSPAWLLD